jgi:hypothetical protein
MTHERISPREHMPDCLKRARSRFFSYYHNLFLSPKRIEHFGTGRTPVLRSYLPFMDAVHSLDGATSHDGCKGESTDSTIETRIFPIAATISICPSDILRVWSSKQNRKFSEKNQGVYQISLFLHDRINLQRRFFFREKTR